jgi:hypothetical protein
LKDKGLMAGATTTTTNRRRWACCRMMDDIFNQRPEVISIQILLFHDMDKHTVNPIKNRRLCWLLCIALF